ncbi:uncharacterized protein LOC131148446 [Malania oleifera]|uniref:uncharacterized protein LOC131148446 n=1 Tax=Malania oleifera TaxID=397392 RepID=UPI0025ADC554|nr:uncharacterized protein LOC131148446 [Malania oleifera]
MACKSAKDIWEELDNKYGVSKKEETITPIAPTSNDQEEVNHGLMTQIGEEVYDLSSISVDDAFDDSSVDSYNIFCDECSNVSCDDVVSFYPIFGMDSKGKDIDARGDNHVETSNEEDVNTSAMLREILSEIQAKRLLLEGSQGYFAFVKEALKEELKLEDIPVIREFSDFFPEDVLGLPLDRKVEFSIELNLGIAPISKAPNRMALTELKKLKE